MHKPTFRNWSLIALAAGLALPLLAAEQADIGTADKSTLEKAYPSKPNYSPYAGRTFPTQPLFGDTHLHTSFSMDAGAFGARLAPKDAYRFARGEEIASNSGQPVKLSRPLDFLVVADHSDGMGFFPQLMGGDPDLLATPQGRKWYDQIKGGQGADAAMDIIASFSGNKMPKGFPTPGTTSYRNAWQQTIKAAETYNEPGRFTAFIGYEWTAGGSSNLHRNVVFRGNGAQAGLVEPFTTLPPLGSPNPTDLWKWMAATEQKTGSEVLAIAHNGNLSNGIMFPVVEAFGKRLDRDYVQTRARWEPLYEVTQTKGTGEAHPFLSPNDEFANFELWDKGNLDGTATKTKDMLEFEYARAALKNGLVLEAKLGTNPYKFGMIGSSDAHTGLAAMEEDNFFGKTAPQEPSPERMTKAFVDNPKTGVKIMDWEVSASGFAAVWATENTREAIFDAMKRRETYATTGPRMIVRFFGGWDYAAADANNRMPAAIGYAKGVPMGGDLSNAPQGKSPTFLVAALKDAIGANLDRIQIVKGWVGPDGKTQERVYDVAVSGGRKIDADGRCKTPVGNTVDVENATWMNSIGAPELITVWKDPQFDAKQRAFYYARVIEIPTPRWTAYDAKRFAIKPLPGTAMVLQERAYTAPIWYTP
ncbi:DUF3604 domain-containing protein [Ramlibacter ginsenosidimutans]|uniref:DUF3604 domain-containing protein n=1 Tax=Ramlibacter ginsenosidimutans TaxID=502333 RepID=A0A934TPC9_9BURK|nr:DUF3604 domain-containing protein [Ramlibacter ginsenosidimutans]MBK6004770.1 DUF3604 domain-containing protein [Ramlibacter ginsenosidimutans]